jgi:TetR/AcrR family transcriptional regulator, regulator of cefoperazone and chloramphenicol sensitivity
VAESSPTGTSVSRRAGPQRRLSEGRLRLLAAAEQLYAARGLEVPNREIVAAADLHNQSAVTYHFGSRAGLIGAVRERHETPIAEHRRHLISRLPAPEDRTTRQLIDAQVQPLAAEMFRCAPSHWARLSELLLMDQTLRFNHDVRTSLHAQFQTADTVLAELIELTVAHLNHLPRPEAAHRVALTIQFLNTGLARWERDSEAGLDGVAPLATFTLMLTDLAVAMLDAPSSVPPPIDAPPGHHTRAVSSPYPHNEDGREPRRSSNVAPTAGVPSRA